MKAIRLKTEFLFEPVGIDIDRPRLFWNCQGGARQTAYEIAATAEDGRTLWESGRVESPSMRAHWGGKPVPPRTRVTWSVRLWDENNVPGEWSSATFETGLPKGEPWRARWIAGDYDVDKRRRYPVDCFCKRFPVSDAERARLYITACGLYETRLNGSRVGDFVLAPGHTDYRKRMQYQTYDVTALLKEGRTAWRSSWQTAGTGAAAGPGGCSISTAPRPSCWLSWSMRMKAVISIPFVATAPGSGAMTALSALPTTRTVKL